MRSVKCVVVGDGAVGTSKQHKCYQQFNLYPLIELNRSVLKHNEHDNLKVYYRLEKNVL